MGVDWAVDSVVDWRWGMEDRWTKARTPLGNWNGLLTKRKPECLKHVIDNHHLPLSRPVRKSYTVYNRRAVCASVTKNTVKIPEGCCDGK